MPSEKENNNQMPKHKAVGLELSCQFNSVFSEEQAKPDKRSKIGVKNRAKGYLYFFAAFLVTYFTLAALKFYDGFSKVGVEQFTSRLSTMGGMGFDPEYFPPLMEMLEEGNTDDAGIAFITNYRFYTKSILSRHTVADFSIIQYVSKNDFLKEDNYIRANPAVRTLLFDFAVDEDSSILVTIRHETPKDADNQGSGLIIRIGSDSTTENPDSVILKKEHLKVPPNAFVLCDQEQTTHFYKKINNDIVFTENMRGAKGWSNNIPVFALKDSLLFPGRRSW